MATCLENTPGQAAAFPLPVSSQGVDMPDRAAGAELGVWERGLAAGTAAIISTLVVNPLELVKTRMQVQAWSLGVPHAPAAALRYSPSGHCSSTGCSAAWRMPHHASAHAAALPAAPAYRSALEGLLRIARYEGPAVLWRGTDVSLMVAVPMVMLYFPLYETLLERCQQSAGSTAAPLVAGAAARTAVVFATSPLELIRVRMQGQGAPAKPLPYGEHLLQVVRQLHQEGQGRGIARFGHFWRGMGATLAKDVPFAAGYWMLFEPARKLLLAPQHSSAPATEASRSQVYSANAAAGFCAAFAAAFVTTPLDVVKTHAQMDAVRRGMAQTAAIITRTGGVRSLFTGAGPRSVRAGCAYAILMSSYEAFKSLELGAHHSS